MVHNCEIVSVAGEERPGKASENKADGFREGDYVLKTLSKNVVWHLDVMSWVVCVVK